jgi:TolB-like protein
MSLIAELKRRKVFKVGAAYLVVAWLAVQAASIGFPAFDAPPWALRIFILVALLGFPVAVVLAWVFDSTPDGMVVDQPARGGKLVFGAAALLAVLAVGWYFYGQPSFRKGDAATPRSAHEPAPAQAAKASPNSIAVLPFRNMSSDKENEYFADGISEELLNVLARIDTLEVASRTSAFSFRDKDVPVAQIASVLKVAHVLEGSVRKQGNRVRITAQLIDAASDKHLWSDTYDRDLDDIFAVQQEIAQAISKELGRVLGHGDALAEVQVQRPTSDLGAYEAYLSGRELFHRRGAGLAEARRLLEDAVQRDARFADAWATLAAVHAVSPTYLLIPRDEAMNRAWDAAQRAIALDNKNSLAHAVQGRVLAYRGAFADASAALSEAITLGGKDSTPFLWRALNDTRLGEFDKARADIRRCLEIDPLLGINHGWNGILAGLTGDRRGGDAELARAAELGWSAAAYYQAMFALGDGRREDAAALLRTSFVQRGAPADYGDAVVAAVLDPARKPALVALVTQLNNEYVDGVGTASTLAALGLYQEAIVRSLAKTAGAEDVGSAVRWFPTSRGMMSEPAYLELAEREGLMAWWRANGFPQGCVLVASAPRHLDCSERWRAVDVKTVR